MEFLQIAVSSVCSIAALFLLTRLMGNRQMSQLSMFDYVNGITIGSIAAEMATNLDDDPLYPLLAMVVYAAIAVAISFCSMRFPRSRNFLIGKPIVLYDNGALFRENLRRAKIDLLEFLTECRVNGYFDLQQLEIVALETNGKFSFLPCADARPATPADLALSVARERPFKTVVMDGVLLPESLRRAGQDEGWLRRELEKRGAKSLKDVFLAQVGPESDLRVYLTETADPPPADFA